MSKEILYFLVLIAPVLPAFVVLTHDTDLPKETRTQGADRLRKD